MEENYPGRILALRIYFNHIVKPFILVLLKSIQHYEELVEFPEEHHRCGIEYSDFENRKVLEFRVFDGNMFNCLLISKQK